LEEILDYLIANWTHREIENFKKKLSKQINLIKQFPKMSPVSAYNPKLRKSVLSKQTTLFYSIIEEEIYLVYLFVNSKNIEIISNK